jgi:GT2 family glycosyltransferase
VSDVSVVVPNWNGRELLGPCLEAVRAAAGGDLRVEAVVVDNASADGSAAYVRERFPEVVLIENARNEGFARACNRGVAATHAPLVLLLNTDAVLTRDALAHLVDCMRTHPRAAVVGAQLRNADGSFQCSHLPFPSLWVDWMILSGLGRFFHGAAYPSRAADEHLGAQSVEWVGGACMLARRAAYEEAGGLDEEYFLYGEEMDLCYRLRRSGWEVWYEPRARVVHLGGGSSVKLGARSEAVNHRSRVRFFRLHHGERAARLATWMILFATAFKIPLHALLRAVSRGRRGRTVVALRQLRAELRQP